MSATPDVVVVGGGVVGAACARALARRAFRVVVCEPGPLPGAASPASAGMLAAQIEPDDALLALAVRARDLYAELAPALRDATGIDIHLWHSGILSVAFDEARADALQRAVAHQRQAGLPCDWLAGAEVAERWPGLAPGCVGALLAVEDGSVDPVALTRALLADAAAGGASVRPASVTEVLTSAGRAAGVRMADGATLPAAHVVLAAGAWTPALAGLPRALVVEPVRGQLATLPWPAPTPPAIAFHGHHYVLARGGEAVCGSTMERAGFDARTTETGLAEIRREAHRLLPALAGAAVTRAWAGLRPLTPDGRGIVGPEEQVSGLWYAAGHGRSGVLFAGLTGEIIGDLVATGATELDIAPWRPRADTPRGGG
jgi:glycine oxidase